MDPVTLSVLGHALAGVAEEMSAALVRSAYSPNIKERRDCSCAVFDPRGRMAAQAEDIPVHLGAMPFSVAAAVASCPDPQSGDVIVLNDPYHGGAHLPDLTFVAPVFLRGSLLGYVAARAHHADVGGTTPGSLPAGATEIYQEGLILPPVRLWRAGKLDDDLWRVLLANVRTPLERAGDLRAQLAAVHVGAHRLAGLADRYGPGILAEGMDALMAYAERRMTEAIGMLPVGSWAFEDTLDEGQRVRVVITREAAGLTIDFAGSSPQTRAPVNAPLAVTASAVYYCLRTVLDPGVPPNDGAWRGVRIIAPKGTVVNAVHPAPVGGGNLELSQRIVDVVFGAFAQAVPDRVPAASQGTMNNLTLGGVRADDGTPYSFYETIAGGAGALPDQDGLSGRHSHMTNTLNTPIEALELAYPLRVERYELRPGTGGAGVRRGGDGLRRDIRVLGHTATVSLLADRRVGRPYGLAGGEPGSPGEDWLMIEGEAPRRLPAKGTVEVAPDGVISVRTPGGGGYGTPASRGGVERAETK